MRTLILGSFLLGAAALATAQENPPAVGMLPPHPLDSLFAEKDAMAGPAVLAKSKLVKDAWDEALKAKAARAKELKQKPAPGPSPEQAARQRFLEVLNSGTVEKPKGAPAPKP